MEINYWWLTLVFLVLAGLVYWLIKRNLKDEKVLKRISETPAGKLNKKCLALEYQQRDNELMFRFCSPTFM